MSSQCITVLTIQVSFTLTGNFPPHQLSFYKTTIARALLGKLHFIESHILMLTKINYAKRAYIISLCIHN